MKPHIRTIACCCLISSAVPMLAGCGNKGALTLPTAQAGTLGKSAVAKSPDHSSPVPAEPKPAPQ